MAALLKHLYTNAIMFPEQKIMIDSMRVPLFKVENIHVLGFTHNLKWYKDGSHGGKLPLKRFPPKML